MRYNVVKNASEIIDDSKILVRNPENYIGNWSSVFGNNNPIPYNVSPKRRFSNLSCLFLSKGGKNHYDSPWNKCNRCDYYPLITSH